MDLLSDLSVRGTFNVVCCSIILITWSSILGGHVLAHAVHTRILMKKGRENNRICRLIDSPSMPEAEAMIQLAAGGITDVDD